jgi:protein expanded
MLRDEVTRHQYYLQLKNNALHQESPKEYSEQSLLLLGGLSLQADLGDCQIDNLSEEYFRAEEYIPSSLQSSWGVSALHSCHKENRGMSRADAETHFIREACGLAMNAHIFKMKNNKNDNGLGSTLLIIYAKGLKIVNESLKLQPVTFSWSAISKLSFDRKKFELRSGDNKITLFSGSDDKNKMLLALCRDTHQFSMKIAPRLTEAMKREEEESNSLHAFYLYPRTLNIQCKSKNDQRISVISSTSSNTTSGIISDRVHSEDELEILINAPPIAAPSTESLAQEHLLDCPSVSRQTSSVGHVSINNLERALSMKSNSKSVISEENETINNNKDKDTDLTQILTYSVESKCSSTCNTNDVKALSSSKFLGEHSIVEKQQIIRINSNLSFCHTVQSSGISQHCDHDDEETTSGVYTINNRALTETSGVYTMNNSELMGESEKADSSHESSHYGSFHPNSEIGEKTMICNNADSVDGGFCKLISDENNKFRARSDSNTSVGSFRGDGSDPNENKHSPLSAEELTDLIVGRGSYPSHKTISNTMDSDCDYVTFSLEGESYLHGSEATAPTEDEYENDLLEIKPPAPPKRIDSRLIKNDADIPEPPPYNSCHKTTGLRGPTIIPEIPSLPKRKANNHLKNPHPPIITSSIIVPEESPARFIKTRPHINILKAHSIIGEPAKPSFSAPTVSTINNLSQSPLPGSMDSLKSSQNSLSHSLYHDTNPSSRTCVLLPIIKPRIQPFVPPPTMPRQPPPPPPTQFSSVFTGQLARSQIELYQQQLYSDVDYVIYPLQDPAISQQEYLDSKQGSILAAMAHAQPPSFIAYHTVRANNRSWDANKGHALYRSTPFLTVGYSSPSRYASTQNLSDTYVQLPSTYSPYSPSVASLCSSYEPPPPSQIFTNAQSSSTIISRSLSDDNILNSVDVMPKSRRPIPPPPIYNQKLNRKPPIPIPTNVQGNSFPPAGTK